MNRTSLAAALLLLAATAAAQDFLTIGTGAAQSGQVASIPVSIRDRTGTPLGTDAAVGDRIQGFAFKVLFPPELISSVAFTRGGVTAPLTPLYESGLQGTGWASYVGAFSAADDPILLAQNAPAPGTQVGTLLVTLRGDAPSGAIIPLTLDPAGAILSNQAGSVHETVADGSLMVVNGSVTVATLAAPPNLTATNVGRTHVEVTWTGVTNADHYEIWRRNNGGPFVLVGTSTGTSYSDSDVLYGPSYLYRARAVDGGGAESGFSNVDPATLIEFVNDPLVAAVTEVRAVHLTQLRAAINALRVSAGLSAMPADPTVNTAGVPVLARHVNDLRTWLNEGRVAAGIPLVAFSDSTLTPEVTVIKAVHVQQLRDGVK